MLIATVLKSGGDYDAEYVHRIQAGLKRHTPAARMVCLSDCPVPCDRIPLVPGHGGWWNKVQLFRTPFAEPVLYVDLDTIIVGDVTPLFDYDHRFTMISDFYRPALRQSGVMAFSGDWRQVWQTYAEKTAAITAQFAKWPNLGDGAYIASQVPDDRFDQHFPKDWIQSAKINGDRSKAILGCFHGRPRPRQTNWQWPELQGANRGGIVGAGAAGGWNANKRRKRPPRA